MSNAQGADSPAIIPRGFWQPAQAWPFAICSTPLRRVSAERRTLRQPPPGCVPVSRNRSASLPKEAPICYARRGPGAPLCARGGQRQSAPSSFFPRSSPCAAAPASEFTCSRGACRPGRAQALPSPARAVALARPAKGCRPLPGSPEDGGGLRSGLTSCQAGAGSMRGGGPGAPGAAPV